MREKAEEHENLENICQQEGKEGDEKTEKDAKEDGVSAKGKNKAIQDDGCVVVEAERDVRVNGDIGVTYPYRSNKHLPA
jgi:hypothetical protein